MTQPNQDGSLQQHGSASEGELRACPFCGAVAELHDHEEGTGGHMVVCSRKGCPDFCGAMMVAIAEYIGEPYENNRRRVVASWNRRADDGKTQNAKADRRRSGA